MDQIHLSPLVDQIQLALRHISNMNSVAELTAVLANPALVEASWRVLCSHRSSFEGGGVAVGSLTPWQAGSRVPLTRAVRGTVAFVAMSCPRTPQQRWDVATVSGVMRQWRRWPHRADSDGDDRSRRPDVTEWSCISTYKIFEGAAGPPSRARHVSRTGVGGTVSRS
jgi:hypothetical protein